jgi:hypothetical protein
MARLMHDPASKSLTFAATVQRLVECGRKEADAKTEICNALAGLRLRVRVQTKCDCESGQPPIVLETNDVEIPGDLNPNRLDWVHSRPMPLYPWRTRSQTRSWAYSDISRVEVNADDFEAELCGDLSSVRLPDLQVGVAGSRSLTDSIEDIHGLAVAEWSPSQPTVDAIAALADSETIPLSEALSVMAFGSHVESIAGDNRETAARWEQAARSLCDAARSWDILMTGVQAGQTDAANPIPKDYFMVPRCSGPTRDSLARDYERRAASPDSNKEQRWLRLMQEDPEYADLYDVQWLKVEVDVPSFVKWVISAITAKRKSLLRQGHSRRLFDYPFWSIETALRWIAFRNPDSLAPRKELEDGTLVETQPELRLLGALQSGRLVAHACGESFPKTHWTSSFPKPGGLSAASPIARLDRMDVLGAFPETALGPDRREARLSRHCERMRRTRSWISCSDIAEWCGGGTTRKPDRENKRKRTYELLLEAFLAGQFKARGRSRLCLLSPETSVVHLTHPPLDRRERWNGQRGEVNASFLERCWLPNEVCRAWFQQQGLDFPSDFVVESKVRELVSPENKVARPPGRPSDRERYLKLFFCRLMTGKTVSEIKNEAELIAKEAAKSQEIQYKMNPSSVENTIRFYYSQWRETGDKFQTFVKVKRNESSRK